MQSGRFALDDRDGLLARGGLEDPVPLVLEGVTGQRAVRVVVVHHQNGRVGGVGGIRHDRASSSGRSGPRRSYLP